MFLRLGMCFSTRINGTTWTFESFCKVDCPPLELFLDIAFAIGVEVFFIIFGDSSYIVLALWNKGPSIVGGP